LAGEPADQRDREGKRLSAARLAAAEHVATGESVGQRLDLDRERAGDVARSERSDQWCTYAEIGKSVGSINVWCLSALEVARLPVGNIDRRDTNRASERGWKRMRFTTCRPSSRTANVAMSISGNQSTLDRRTCGYPTEHRLSIVRNSL
jgi:hypothetical protein